MLSLPKYRQSLNKICQEIWNKNQEEVFTDVQGIKRIWRVNDRIIWKNHLASVDSKHPVISKGTKGIIIGFDECTGTPNQILFRSKDSTKTYGSVRIQFEDRSNIETVTTRNFLSHAELGYALTVHESRGSAFNHVLCLFEDDNATTRNMLYTAITRAKEKCILAVPSKVHLDRIVERKYNFDGIRTMVPEKFRYA